VPRRPRKSSSTRRQSSAKSTAAPLLRKIRNKSATVAVVGLGYIGLPLARAIFDARYKVIGYDIDNSKIEKLSRGESYLHHLKDVAKPLFGSKRFVATADAGLLAEADVIILCVPTPLDAHSCPDLTYVLDSTRLCASALRPGQLIVLESTTYPGTTRREMQPILEATGLVCGEDFFLAYSPEREDPGSKDFSTRTIPKLVGGLDEISANLAQEFYSRVVSHTHRVSSAEVAETAKLLENIFRAVNIAMVNELKVVLNDMGIDIWEVIAAASTKPFGFMPFYPGPGLGGHCIPIDPFYLTWKAKEIGRYTKFI
jgi:UDP-N-acetyl-D-glucosamine dehydrogenase